MWTNFKFTQKVNWIYTNSVKIDFGRDLLLIIYSTVYAVFEWLMDLYEDLLNSCQKYTMMGLHFLPAKINNFLYSGQDLNPWPLCMVAHTVSQTVTAAACIHIYLSTSICKKKHTYLRTLYEQCNVWNNSKSHTYIHMYVCRMLEKYERSFFNFLLHMIVS